MFAREAFTRPSSYEYYPIYSRYGQVTGWRVEINPARVEPSPQS